MTHFLIAYGLPGPQGSKSFKGFSKAGKAIMAESSAKVKPWRQDVAASVERYLAAHRPGWTPIATAQRARMVFTLPKPKSAPKTIRTVPDKYPDVSKLARSTEDALVQAGLLKDDSLIVGYSRLEKVYPGEDPEALEAPGVQITLDDYLDAPLHPSVVCDRCGGFAPTHRCRPGALLPTSLGVAELEALATPLLAY